MTPDSEALQMHLSRAALGDRAAFKSVYDMSSAHLYAVAMRVVRKPELADEVLQEAFINVWRHAASYNPANGQAMTWLINIVRNKALDLARSAKVRHEIELAEDAESGFADIEDERPHALALLTQASESLAIAGCMNSLDASHRQSLALAYYHGLSHSELAEHLATPLGTVKAWLKRGLERLKQCLEGKL